MPTAAKLTAAAVFALVGLIAAHLFALHMPEGSAAGHLRELTAAIGFIVGWLWMGPRSGTGYRDALGTGVVTSVMVVFWAVLGFSIYLMIRKSMRLYYDGPMEAVVGVFDLMIEHGKQVLMPDVLAVLFIGGLLGGMITEWAGRRWR